MAVQVVAQAAAGNQTLGDGSFLFDNNLVQMSQTKKNRPQVFDNYKKSCTFATEKGKKRQYVWKRLRRSCPRMRFGN